MTRRIMPRVAAILAATAAFVALGVNAPATAAPHAMAPIQTASMPAGLGGHAVVNALQPITRTNVFPGATGSACTTGNPGSTAQLAVYVLSTSLAGMSTEQRDQVAFLQQGYHWTTATAVRFVKYYTPCGAHIPTIEMLRAHQVLLPGQPVPSRAAAAGAIPHAGSQVKVPSTSATISPMSLTYVSLESCQTNLDGNSWNWDGKITACVRGTGYVYTDQNSEIHSISGTTVGIVRSWMVGTHYDGIQVYSWSRGQVYGYYPYIQYNVVTDWGIGWGSASIFFQLCAHPWVYANGYKGNSGESCWA